MKTFFKTSAFLLFLLIFQSCTIYEPISTKAPANNGTYKVDYLFEHDGCKVYRFQDMGRWVYFTTCSGSVTSFQNDSIHTPIMNTIQKAPSLK